MKLLPPKSAQRFRTVRSEPLLAAEDTIINLLSTIFPMGAPRTSLNLLSRQ